MHLRLILSALAMTLLLASARGEFPDFTVRVVSPVAAPKGQHWMQVRAGVVPAKALGREDGAARIVVTMQLIDSGGTHMYHDIASMWTEDLGETWHGPTTHRTLGRRNREGGLLEVPVDATPAWHAASGRLLLTGATFFLSENLGRDVPGGASSTAWSAYDPANDSWSEWSALNMPEGGKFRYARAGCTQRVDLPGGDILLPFYFGEHNNSIHWSSVAVCRFEGDALRYVRHGEEMKLDFGRGFSEPSLARFGDRFFLTLRNDKVGWVAASQDGLRFEEPVPWKFDDGGDLGSYNTQQHWVTHSGGLFLVYTRRAGDNDQVMRHRAPLFMARIDPDTLRVLRGTERVLLPKISPDGLDVNPKSFGMFGNFGTCNVSPEETWVTAGLAGAPEGHPSVHIARIQWSKPNAHFGGAEPR